MKFTGSAVFFLIAFSSHATAQAGTAELSFQHDTTVAAGRRYEAGRLHRFLFGSEYRSLWTAPISVPILNLQATGGGLTPTTAGGGFQTKSLWFLGNNGLRYGFRSVDKDPDVLPPGLQGTLVERLVQDQISSAHPAGPAVAARLMSAAGILHSRPHLVVLPDDPSLGEFRERFAGTLGFFEQRAVVQHAVPFAGAIEIIDSDELLSRVQAGPENRIDTREFLNARLFDLLIGDWDRHRGQWAWARFDDDSETTWVPIPEDRDEAFVRFDGLLLSMGRVTTPQLVNFGDNYPDMFGLTWNGRELDRKFLVELDWPVWDSVVTTLQLQITDSVIDSAVAQMPPEYRNVDAIRMARALRKRRDALRDAALQFYRLLAREVAVHGTDAPERVTAQRHDDGSTEVTVTAMASSVGAFFQRRFLADETAEIRVYLHGGDDRAVVNGATAGITLRFIGGAGDDVLADSSGTGSISFYTDDGDRVENPNRVAVDRREFVLPPKRRPSDLPPRDWGSLYRGVPWSSFGPDLGLFIGGGAYRIKYGFRHIPYASRIQIRAGYSTGGTTGRVDLSIQLRRSNSNVRVELDGRASGIEVLRFHGFGNETVLTGPNDNEYYRVNHTQYSLAPTLIVPVTREVEFSSGPILRYSSTINESGRYLETIPQLYGAGKFGQVGWKSRLTIDTRDVVAAATKGVRLELGGAVYPEMWDVETTYGQVHGSASTYLSATAAPLRPTLALRVGGEKVLGDYAFQDAAFIGDESSARLGRQNRYGGDAAVYANAELRLKISDIFLVLPGEFGVFGLGDVGRVYLEGEDSNRWHNAVGGGVWVSFLGRANTLSAALARSEVGTILPQRTSVYVQGGFAF